MIRWFLLAAGAILLLVAGDAPRRADALIVTPSVKQGACATNYARFTPNFCQRTSTLAFTFALLPNPPGACQALTLSPAVPASARSAIIVISLAAQSANAVALRSYSLSVWHEVGCTTLANQATIETREQVAVVALTRLGSYVGQMHVPVTNGQIFISVSGNAESRGLLAPLGYYD